MCAIPRDRFLQPIVQRCSGLPVKIALCHAHIEKAVRLAIGPVRVPNDLSREAGYLDQRMNDIGDAGILATGEIHDLWLLIYFRVRSNPSATSPA